MSYFARLSKIDPCLSANLRPFCRKGENSRVTHIYHACSPSNNAKATRFRRTGQCHHISHWRRAYPHSAWSQYTINTQLRCDRGSTPLSPIQRLSGGSQRMSGETHVAKQTKVQRGRITKKTQIRPSLLSCLADDLRFYLLYVCRSPGFTDPLTPLRMTHSDASYPKKYRLPA